MYRPGELVRYWDHKSSKNYWAIIKEVKNKTMVISLVWDHAKTVRISSVRYPTVDEHVPDHYLASTLKVS